VDSPANHCKGPHLTIEGYGFKVSIPPLLEEYLGYIRILLQRFTVRSNQERDSIITEAPMLEEAQRVLTLGSLRYSSLQTRSAKTPNLEA
jgi:hypothetical protein